MKQYYNAVLLICMLGSIDYIACMEKKEDATTPLDDNDDEWVKLDHEGGDRVFTLISPIPDAIQNIKTPRPPSPVQQDVINPTSPIQALIVTNNAGKSLSSPKSPRSPLFASTSATQEIPKLIVVIPSRESTPPPSLPSLVRAPEPLVVAAPSTLNQPSQSLASSHAADSAQQSCMSPTPTVISLSMPIIMHQHSPTNTTYEITRCTQKPHAAARAPLLPYHDPKQIILPRKPSNPLPLITTSSIVQSLLNILLDRRTCVENPAKKID